mmetsp:Transcript_17768/g.29213  ORF Transcript_17768/g.29213 Transcript_17768/m.29213 type:complete len:122 (-) Transcript_17768:152-517(-)
MGVCMLPRKGDIGGIHRRLDIVVCPYLHFPYSLLYFTGSGTFNRQMRWRAHLLGLRLSDKTLAEVTRFKDGTVIEGRKFSPVHTEYDLFVHLGLRYYRPHERSQLPKSEMIAGIVFQKKKT